MNDLQKRALQQLLWFLGGAGLMAGLIFATVHLLNASFTPEQAGVFAAYVTQHKGPLIMAAACLVVAAGWFGVDFYERYPAAVRRLVTQIDMMVLADQHKALEHKKGAALAPLVEAIDRMSERFQTLQERTEDEVRVATRSLEAERNRLAALMAELEQAVIVCNMDGRILLYNQRAKALFARDDGVAMVGLGRSIFAVVPNEIGVHAVMRLRESVLRQGAGPKTQVRPVTTLVPMAQGRLLRVHFAAVLPNQGMELGGMVLLLEEVTETIERDQRRHLLLRSLTEASRAGIANMRAAAENLQHFPDMPEEQRGRFLCIIGEEAESLGDQLDNVLHEYADTLATHWPLEELRAQDLLTVIRNSLEQAGMSARIEDVDQDLWLTADSYTLSMATQAIAANVSEQLAARDFCLCVRPRGKHVELDLLWTHRADAAVDMRALEELAVDQVSEAQGQTVRDVVDRHGAELWTFAEAQGGRQGLRMLLSAVPTPTPLSYGGTDSGRPASRPEFYDFDLFEHIGERTDLEGTSLDALTYTVFDTETTGLDTSVDEIISIGALRIVNGRVLYGEVYEQLVDPQRNIGLESEKIHGISNEMIRGKPTVGEVLPAFHGFCEDTVLVAHNAAFDMRMLQRAQSRAEVSFDAFPVLDTLLLSAVVYPEPGAHGLEKVAARFGINVVGRHTALGDAIVTAQVLVKLIELLKGQGINTLGAALRAAQQTYLARIKY